MEWLQTVRIDQAVQEIGLFGNRNTVCKPTTPKWRSTVERLKDRFPDFDKPPIQLVPRVFPSGELMKLRRACKLLQLLELGDLRLANLRAVYLRKTSRLCDLGCWEFPQARDDLTVGITLS